MHSEKRNKYKMNKKDYYKVLELSESDKKLQGKEFEDKLKKNYRKLSMKYHPDRNTNKSDKEKKEAEEKFKDCVEAYEILSDTQKRQHYDIYGTMDGSQFNGGGFGNMSDVMKEFMRHAHGFGFNPFDDGPRQRVYKGSDIKVNVTLTLEELFNGGKRDVTYNKEKECKHCKGSGLGEGGRIDKCPHCNGSGYIVRVMQHGFAVVQQQTTCPHCNGSGETIINGCKHCGSTGNVREKHTITIDIPNGVVDNSYITVQGQGNRCARSQGVDGDLIVIFKIKEHKDFDVSSTNPFNLMSLIEVPILDCITGCEFNVVAIDGKTYKVNVKPNTEQGTTLRLKGLGLRKNNGSRGDFDVIVKHKFPSTLSEEEIEKINELKELKNFK